MNLGNQIILHRTISARIQHSLSFFHLLGFFLAYLCRNTVVGDLVHMPEGYKHFSKTKPMKLEHFQPVLDWWNERKEITEDGFDKAKKFTVQQLTEELGYNLDQCGYPHEEEEILAPMDLIHRYEEQRASLNAEIDRVLAEITSLLGGNAE